MNKFMHEQLHENDIYDHFQAKPKKLEAELAGFAAELLGKEADFAGLHFRTPKNIL